MNPEEVLPPLNAPPDQVPARPPVQTVISVLPFSELSWENFEKLCYRLSGQGDQVEHHSRYGRAGQAQQGIDIYVRKSNGKYDVWQAKRYAQYSVSKLKTAISAFMKGSWPEKTEYLYIAVQASLADTNIQDEVESQAKKLRAKGVTLIAMGGEELSERLRSHPNFVHDFFGRAWTEAFFGGAIGPAVLDRLDGDEFARVRTQLTLVYQTHFHLLDRGIVEPLASFRDTDPIPTLGLLERFTPPDVLIRERRTAIEFPAKEDTGQDSASAQLHRRSEPANRWIEQFRRAPLSSWLAEGEQLALVGDAGAGKSTILRCIALDILGDQTCFPDLDARWGQRLPLFVSFAKWARDTEAAGGQVSLKEVVRGSLQSLLTLDLVGLLDRAIDERRVLLLVDGLDEWSNEQAARTALQVLFTFVGAHKIPTVVTARPRGLDKIGAIPQSWTLGTLAPLSPLQQREFVAKWFARRAGTQPKLNASTKATVEWETERFFRELKKDAGLSALAGTPLLLVSLIALALRQVTLPRNRAQALDQLIEILLEVHPQSRATASGDVQPRFMYASDLEVRRGALSKLAFASRSEGWDAGYPASRAKKHIRVYLCDPELHGFSIERSVAAANEMLAVNAETVGLLIEKVPGEVGFAHAIFEEYLSAVHIQSWPLDRLIEFVKEKAVSQRWRNVIANLIAITTRPAEIDQLITAIESIETDVLGAINRRLLLADVAFSPSKMSSATARRLAGESFASIEGGGWNGERSQLLSSALNGTNDPALGELVLDKLEVWAPRKHAYPESFFRALESWSPDPHLQYALRRGLFDESRSGQRAAARALATVYKGVREMGEWLTGLFHGGTDLLVTSVAIEALTLGWSSIGGLDILIDEARASVHPSLRLSAIWAKIQRGHHDEDDLIVVLGLLEDFSELAYWDRSLAEEALLQGWPDHPLAVDSCLRGVKRDHGYPKRRINIDSAMRYLLHCAPNTAEIQKWVLEEVDSGFPFVGITDRRWDQALPFAEANSEIRERIVQVITAAESRHLDYQISGVLAALKDERLKQFALRKVHEADNWSLYWYAMPLIKGWTTADSDVVQLCEEILKWPNSRMIDLISLLPDIIPDRQKCRSRLLALAKAEPEARHDLLVSAFVQLGCDTSDQEVVDLLLSKARSTKALFNGSGELIINFSGHSRVRAFALELLEEREPPIGAIAIAYKGDAQIRKKVLSEVMALPTSLRYLVAEAASIEADRHIRMRRLLEHYDWEDDTDLKVTLAIRHYELIRSVHSDRTAPIERLLADARAVGPDFEKRRSAVFAGLVVLKATARLAPLTEAGKPLGICIGSYRHQSNALLQLLINCWDEIKGGVGDLLSRIGAIIFWPIPQTWEALAPYVGANESVRQDFVVYCETSAGPLGARSLRALSRERPISDLLERHCWRAIDPPPGSTSLSPLDLQRGAIEAAYLLRDHFSGRPEISKRLHERLLEYRRDEDAIALALYDPHNPVFANMKIRVLDIGLQQGKWAVAVHVAAESQSTPDFIEVMRGMVNRNRHSPWHFQDTINVAIQARLVRDEEAANHVRRVLTEEPTPNEIASLPRYIAAAGALDVGAYETCRALLDLHYNRTGVPLAGYDAYADEVRPVTHSLLDALSGPLGS